MEQGRIEQHKQQHQDLRLATAGEQAETGEDHGEQPVGDHRAAALGGGGQHQGQAGRSRQMPGRHLAGAPEPAGPLQRESGAEVNQDAAAHLLQERVIDPPVTEPNAEAGRDREQHIQPQQTLQQCGLAGHLKTQPQAQQGGHVKPDADQAEQGLAKAHQPIHGLKDQQGGVEGQPLAQLRQGRLHQRQLEPASFS